MAHRNDRRIDLRAVTVVALLDIVVGCGRQELPELLKAAPTNTLAVRATAVASEHVAPKQFQAVLPSNFVAAIQAFDRQSDLIGRPIIAKRVHADALKQLDVHSDATVAALRAELEKLLTSVSAKHSRLSERRYQKLKIERTAQPPTASLNSGASVLANLLDTVIPSAQAEPVVTTVETETTQTTTTTDSTIVEDDVATTTQTINGEAKVETANNSVSIDNLINSVIDSVSKTDPSARVVITTRNLQKIAIDLCPDANGQVRGTATAKLLKKMAARQGSTTATSTQDTTLQYEIIGFVNDDAVMTHFDITGSISTTLSGAADAALDGTVSRTVTMNNNKPQGEFYYADPVVSLPVNVATDAQLQYNDVALLLGRVALEPLLTTSIRLAQNAIDNGRCVAVEFGPAKSPFYSLESMEIQATGVSKLSGEKIDSKMDASGDASASPQTQAARPAATILWMAPESGTAFVIATSISKRGQGSEMLRIPVAPKPLPKGAICDEPWVGTISAQNAARTENDLPASGEMISHQRIEEINRNLQAKLTGARDTTGGITNNYRAIVRVYDSVSNTEIRTYKDRVIQCPTVTKFPTEKRTRTRTRQGDETLPLLIAINVRGGKGSLQMTGPSIAARKGDSQIYETGCDSYDEINSFAEPNEPNEEVKTLDLDLEFDAPNNDNAAKGSQFVTESDGRKTQYDWDIKRCGGAPNR